MPNLLQQAAADNTWPALLPELLLAGSAILILLLDGLFRAHRRPLVAAAALAGQAAALAAAIPATADTNFLFNNLIHQTPVSGYFRLFLLAATLITTLIALARKNAPGTALTEPIAIMHVAAAGMTLLAQANNLLFLFVALETVTLTSCLLVAGDRRNPRSLEAALKYLLTGATASALLLFGIVLLYGATVSMRTTTGNPFDFAALANLFQNGPALTETLAAAGLILTLCGVAFKIAAVPFQLWVPDVYEGAPAPVTAFLAIASKAAGFALLYNLITNAFAPASALTAPLLTLLAIATILFGNIAALTQRNIKRLIGLSGIAHAGYLLMTIRLLPDSSAFPALGYYLVTYLLATATLLLIHTQLTTYTTRQAAARQVAAEQVAAGQAAADATQQAAEEQVAVFRPALLDDWRGLHQRSPFLAAAAAIAIASLAGIPPLAGFMGKLLIFIPTFQQGHYQLLAIAVAGVTLSVYYYFGWIKLLYERPAASALPASATRLATTLLWLLTAATLLLGLWPAPLTSLLTR
jgi:NADH-quinone oxidoreductase subunit N